MNPQMENMPAPQRSGMKPPMVDPTKRPTQMNFLVKSAGVYQGAASRAQRNPTLRKPASGSSNPRNDARALPESSYQEPPRSERWTFSVYQSAVHSQTLPSMSKRPKLLGFFWA